MNDIFKGRVNRRGRVIKNRSVGKANTFSDHVELSINGIDEPFYLCEEKNPMADWDYQILTVWQQPVGFGKLLFGDNAGLIHLEWDFFGAVDIYLHIQPLTSVESEAA